MAEEQPLTIEALLGKVKDGLSIPQQNTTHDQVLKQKILGVKTYMINAGVDELQFGDNADESNDGDDLAIEVLTMGVSDTWNLGSGDVKFSPVFLNMLTQLVLSNEKDE